MIRAQIVGATGYGGLGMVELLLRHPEIEIASLLAKNDVGKPISAFFPHLRGFCDMPVEDSTAERIGEDADLVIFATPDGVGMSFAQSILDRGAAVIDYSGDFRFREAEQYARYADLQPNLKGKPHGNPGLMEKGVYGVPELFRSEIQGAKLVGNPGCFAASMILGLAPAVKAGLIEPHSIISDGKTGISGAGKKPSSTHHFPERDENVTPYRVGNHQHAVESNVALGRISGEDVKIVFVPHLVPLIRGIICTMYGVLRRDVTAAEVHDIYCDFYAGEPFVRVLPPGLTPGLKGVLGSNVCDISMAVDQENGRLIIMSSIDNLMKGQAGMALQNINLMFGFPETTGLERLPVYP
jgi:N-acetyl-gamma-glutamyl-phosphate reductase